MQLIMLEETVVVKVPFFVDGDLTIRLDVLEHILKKLEGSNFDNPVYIHSETLRKYLDEKQIIVLERDNTCYLSVIGAYSSRYKRLLAIVRKIKEVVTEGVEC